MRGYVRGSIVVATAKEDDHPGVGGRPGVTSKELVPKLFELLLAS